MDVEGETCAQSEPKDFIIFVIFEGDNNEIGLSVFNLKFRKITMSQFLDDFSYKKTIAKINLNLPSEVILSNRKINILKKIITTQFKTIRVNLMHSKFFDQKRGFEYFQRFSSKKFNDSIDFISRCSTLASLSALISHLEIEKKLAIRNQSIFLHFDENNDTTFIDMWTSKYLQLTGEISSKSKENLFAIVDFTSTRNGMRTLKANILEPPASSELSMSRLDAIEAIIKNKQLFHSLRKSIDQCDGLDEVMRYLNQVNNDQRYIVKSTERKFRCVMRIKNVLKSVRDLLDLLETEAVDCHLLTSIHQELGSEQKHEQIIFEINKLIDFATKIQFNLPAKIESSFYIKPNINGLLDVARRSFAEAVDDMMGAHILQFAKIA